MPITMTKFSNDNPNFVSIARQPIFDNKRRLWGYEIFCVGIVESTDTGSLEESVAVNVASSAYIGFQQIMDRGKKVIVNFNEKSIIENFPYAFPQNLVAVMVAEDMVGRPNVLDMLSRLKSDGYLIVVRGFTGNSECGPLYQMADIVGTDISERQKDELTKIIELARTYDATCLAAQVKDTARFELCRELGFSLFHGSFFKSPDQITVRKFTSGEVSRFNLLQIIEKDPPDFDQLAKTIQTDVSISFRLLAFLNSSAFGLSRKIKSIHQAILLLGWRKIKNWLRVVLLSDMGQNKEISELVLLSAQRGRFLELVAREHDFWGFDPNSLNLLGIFSLLDAILGIPMAEIVGYLPLENKLKAALCQEANNEYLPLLHLAGYFEEARWTEAEKMIRQLNLDSAKVKAAFQASVNWAGELATLQSKSF
jgi:EAL and modified HD-GYP domain-containing signal transduction protein